MTKHARSSFLLTTLVAAMSVAGVAAANVTNDDIRADATNNSQVVTNGMGLHRLLISDSYVNSFVISVDGSE